MDHHDFAMDSSSSRSHSQSQLINSSSVLVTDSAEHQQLQDHHDRPQSESTQHHSDEAHQQQPSEPASDSGLESKLSRLKVRDSKFKEEFEYSEATHGTSLLLRLIDGQVTADPPRDRLTTLSSDHLSYIVDFLPIGTKLVLRQTCHKFRDLIKLHIPIVEWRKIVLHDENKTVLREGQNKHWPGLELLYCVSKNDPDRFACENCLTVHKIPSTCLKSQNNGVREKVCADDWVQPLRASSHIGHQKLMKTFFEIQLALKWSRMQQEGTLSREHSRKLEVLLDSKVATYARFIICYNYGGWWVHFLKNDPHIPMRTDSKVHEGHYLLRTSWDFPRLESPRQVIESRPVEETSTVYSIGDLQVCPHQAHFTNTARTRPNFFDSAKTIAWRRMASDVFGKTSAWERFRRSRCTDAAAVQQGTSAASEHGIKHGYINFLDIHRNHMVHSRTAFKQTVSLAKDKPDVPVYGSCLSCNTDWMVKDGMNGGTTITVWQDLGGEGSSVNPEWRSQVINLGVVKTNQAVLERTVPDSVRQKWEEGVIEPDFMD